MGNIRIPMYEVTTCLICGVKIGPGNDPAICDQEYCQYWFNVEINFNEAVKKGVKNGKN